MTDPDINAVIARVLAAAEYQRCSACKHDEDLHTILDVRFCMKYTDPGPVAPCSCKEGEAEKAYRDTDAARLATALKEALRERDALADFWFGPKMAPIGWWEALCCKAMARFEDEPIWHEEGCVEYPLWMSWRARHPAPEGEA